VWELSTADVGKSITSSVRTGVSQVTCVASSAAAVAGVLLGGPTHYQPAAYTSPVASTTPLL